MSSDSNDAAAEEDADALEEASGCAILDSGATVMCSSTLAADIIKCNVCIRTDPGFPV